MHSKAKYDDVHELLEKLKFSTTTKVDSTNYAPLTHLLLVYPY